MAKKKASVPQSSASAKPIQKFWNQPLTLDFRTFFKALSKSVVHGMIGRKEVAVASLLEAGTAVGVNIPSEQLVWQLLERSLKRAVIALIAEVESLLINREVDLDQLEQAIDAIDKKMLAIETNVSNNLFRRPGDLPVVAAVQAALFHCLSKILTDEAKIKGIVSRLPSYFTFALQEEWTGNRATYGAIKESLDSPFAIASDREEQWNLYSAWLVQQANQRMFDEAFSIEQVYVSLRASFSKSTKQLGSMAELDRTEQPKQNVEWLEECLKAWVQAWNKEDCIRVLSGGPGSGKSAFARRFAATVSETCQCKVVYVPLHMLKLKTELVSAVHDFCREHGYIPNGILDAKDGEQNLLLIFDGLDELEKQGKMASQIASDFVAELRRTCESSNQIKTKLLVLLCGRPVSIQSTESVLRRPEQILHLLPYFLNENERRMYNAPEDILKIDQRDHWWRNYGDCIGPPFEKIPKELSTERLSEISSQPLLNYLLALSYKRKKVDFSREVNLNEVYRDLIDAVHERAWEKSGNTVVTGLTNRDFLRVLEEIGLASWHGDSRTTTVKYIENRCSKSKAVRTSLEQFAGQAASGVTRLLTAFYFRQHGDIEGEKTFEFTHKSFGEYLTARRIVLEIETIDAELRRRDDGSEGGLDEAQSLERWVDICGPSEITHDINRFLINEIASRGLDLVGQWQETCVRLVNYLLRHGLPMEKLSPLPTFKEQDRQARNAEETLLAFMCGCATRAERLSAVSWPKPDSFGSWISRLSPQRLSSENKVALESLAWLQMNRQVIFNQDFHRANLVHSSLISIRAQFCHFTEAILSDANLGDANLSDAILGGANLSHAILRDANLREANLGYANLGGANLGRANLRGANLRDANLRDANLRDANLRDANLRDANLRDANLRDANLRGATLGDADLRDANLR